MPQSKDEAPAATQDAVVSDGLPLGMAAGSTEQLVVHSQNEGAPGLGRIRSLLTMWINCTLHT